MVGNDIVNLEEAENASNWQRPRFLDKLFTSQEKLLIHNSENPFLMVWRFWSMKEAAYKLYTQQNPSRFYNPKGFECYIQNEKGMVKFNDFECQVKTKRTSKYILSEARFMDYEITSKVIELKIKNSRVQSKVLKALLLKELSKSYGLTIEDLKFEKSKFGIPTVLWHSIKIPVSLSHHGCYGAYAI